MKSDCFNTAHDGQRVHPCTQIASRHARHTHTLYSDSEWVANRLGLICLITESPIRSSEALWGIEMFPKISFGDSLGSFDFSAFSCR